MKRTSVYVTLATLFFAIGTVAMLLWSNASAQDAVKDKEVPQGHKWEYKVVRERADGSNGLDTKEIEAAANLLGQEGWECVGTVSEVKGDGNPWIYTNAVLMFKRLKK